MMRGHNLILHAKRTHNARDGSIINCYQHLVISGAAFGPNEALDCPGQYKEMGLIIRGVVFDDFLWRNPSPGVVQPTRPSWPTLSESISRSIWMRFSIRRSITASRTTIWVKGHRYPLTAGGPVTFQFV
jgi:hypothetical protein